MVVEVLRVDILGVDVLKVQVDVMALPVSLIRMLETASK